MATTAPGSRRHAQQLIRCLLGLARTTLAWAFIGLTVLLRLGRLPEMAGRERALVLTAFMLCIGAAVGLLLPSATAAEP